MDAHSGADPFIMNADGRGWLYAPPGVKDGPLPTHYEPFESVMGNALYPKQQSNPCLITFDRPDNPYNGGALQGRPTPAYPYVLTTYRVTEHHTSGGMSRWNSWLAELQPELFVEINPELALEKDIANGDMVTIATSRTEIEARALVTPRMQPMRINGQVTHVIGLPYHWGPAGIVTGDVANDLISVVLEPNVKIHEAKALTCDLRKGARNRQAAAEEQRQPHADMREGGAIDRTHSEGEEMLHHSPLAGLTS